ncbi:MAG: lamin tail domain-containing protein [Deltaproteobacteria bacterium]|nr:lamin tail domain-containing protein [Deltaproteobacteria bacterium]
MNRYLRALAVLGLVMSSACDTVDTTPVAIEGAALTSAPLAPGAYQIEFTNPGTSAATAVDMPADDRVIEAIDQAQATVDIAVFGFDHAGITQAVLRAHARGLRVRLVGHGEELATSNGLKAIQSAGVPMVLRPGGTLMHHKFIIVDGQTVGFGSLNFTTAAATQNDENFVFANSTELAQIFQGEFDQMFGGKFGAKKAARAVRPTVAVEGGSVQLHFSPKEDTATRLREVIASADTRIYFMIYSFTLPEVATDLIAAKNRGVEVVGVFDKGNASSTYSQDDALAAAGVRVALDGNENTSGFAGGRLHDKVMIVDAGGSDPMVVTGSYNWSAGATTGNDETLAILRGKNLVAPYVAEFCRVWKNGSGGAGTPPALCAPRPLVALTEVMANPEGTDRYEEWVEVTNVGTGSLDVSGWTISDALAVRHTFAAGTFIAPKQSLVVYSGASATAVRMVASTGQLALNNDVETVSLADATGRVVDQVGLGLAVSGESMHRTLDGLVDLDFDGRADGSRWDAHHLVSATGLLSSPGVRPDGSLWSTVIVGPVQPEETAGETNDAEVHLASALPNPVGTDRPEEYVVIENRGVVTVDLSGWAIGDLASPYRHVFAAGTLLAPGATIKVYDGGVHADGIPASSGALSLNNSDETLSLIDAHAAAVDTMSWASAAEGQVLSK